MNAWQPFFCPAIRLVPALPMSRGHGPAVLALAVAALGGCAPDSTPVARLDVEPRQIRLAYPHVTPIRLRWEPARPLDRLRGKPVVFVHLLDQRRKVRRTLDHTLPEDWTLGSPIAYELELTQSALKRPLPAGTYLLTLGLYDDSWGYRWPLTIVHAEDIGEREYCVGELVVPQISAHPRFTFSKEWLPNHRLEQPGVIVVRDVVDPGWIVLRMRAPLGLRIDADCDPTGGRWYERGRPWVRIPATPGSCRIDLEPPVGGTLQLEELAWRASAGETKR